MTSGLKAVLDAARPGQRVFVSGSTGEPTALIEAWVEDPDRTRGLEIVSTAVPGINTFPLEALHPTATLTTLFAHSSHAAALKAGQVRHLPTSYGGFVSLLRSGRFDFDLCIAQGGRLPDGAASLGPAVEFLPLVMARAGRTALLTNAATPPLQSSPRLERGDVALHAEVDTLLPRYVTGSIDPAARRIAEIIADRVSDGDALQVGLGKTPAALMNALHDRRGLRLHSGMYGDGVRGLAEAGSLDEAFDHIACVFVGEGGLYDWAATQDRLRIAGCDETHDPVRLAGLGRLLAVNSAVEIDLWGQAALETAGGGFISGAGGAPDFARAARLSPEGLSIVALPSTAARGQASRIVARLSEPGVCTLPRHDIDLVVTEHGVADLRLLSAPERALALINIAHPDFRESLSRAWSAA